MRHEEKRLRMRKYTLMAVREDARILAVAGGGLRGREQRRNKEVAEAESLVLFLILFLDLVLSLLPLEYFHCPCFH